MTERERFAEPGIRPFRSDWPLCTRAPCAVRPVAVVLVTVMLAVAVASAGPVLPPLPGPTGHAPPLVAAASAATGRLHGQAYEESRKPRLPPRPLEGVVVTLLPRSEVLVQQLEAIRQGARDSHDAYRTAIPRMLEIQEVHEKAVRAAGRALLSTRVAPDGAFAFEDVPAGAWVLIARDETLVPRIGAQVSKSDRKMYQVPPTLEAYRTVRLWLRELSVPGDGGVETVRLTDRNVWFTGVVEILGSPAR